jgi:hypothetical protein
MSYFTDYKVRRDIMGTDNQAGWDRDKMMIFDENVVDYDKVRWGYPDKLFADISNIQDRKEVRKPLRSALGRGKRQPPSLIRGTM